MRIVAINRRRQFRAAFCVNTIGELQIENRYTINECGASEITPLVGCTLWPRLGRLGGAFASGESHWRATGAALSRPLFVVTEHLGRHLCVVVRACSPAGVRARRLAWGNSARGDSAFNPLTLLGFVEIKLPRGRVPSSFLLRGSSSRSDDWWLSARPVQEQFGDQE